jgi:hypothetical protein
VPEAVAPRAAAPPAPHPVREDSIGIPRWVLQFMVPGLTLLALGSVAHFRIGIVESQVREMEERIERGELEERTTVRRMEQQVNELCLARVRDDRDSGKTPSVNCDRR